VGHKLYYLKRMDQMRRDRADGWSEGKELRETKRKNRQKCTGNEIRMCYHQYKRNQEVGGSHTHTAGRRSTTP
jgi:hypothetical protein